MTSDSTFLSLAENQRYSCRAYDARPIADDDLNAVLRAAQIAPTAANFQPQRILVLNTPETMEKLGTCTRFVFGAPTALIVCYDRTVAWVRKFDQKSSGDIDASIVVTHMMLEAAERGLGTCWVGFFEPEKLREMFAIPDNYEPSAILIIGYPAANAQPHAMHSQRKGLEETVFFNSFNRADN